MKPLASPRCLDLVPLSEIVSTEVSYLWKPYVPLGRITMLDGDPATGKTYYALTIAAAVTTGRTIRLEDASDGAAVLADCPPRSVVYMSGEDNFADTIKPRFMKAGGDPSRLLGGQGLVSVVDGKKCYSSLTLSDLDELQAAIVAYNPALIVFDPFQAYLGKDVDLHRANEVRPVMSALAQLAEQYGCAILMIRHLNKSTLKAAYRGLGSIDISAAARSVLLAGKHPEDPGRFVMVHHKCSVAREGQALSYSISDSGLTIHGPVSLTADDLLGDPARRARSRVDAVEFVEAFLEDGPKPSEDLASTAEKLGLSKRTLDGAKKELGVITKPSGFRGKWVCSLPQPEVAQVIAESPAVVQEICQ